MFEVISFDILLSKLHNQSKEQTSGLLYFYTSHKMISARESAVFLGTPAFTKAFTRAPFEALFNLSVAYAILRAYLSTSLALEGESGLIAHLRVFPPTLQTHPNAFMAFRDPPIRPAVCTCPS
ncbi:MAG: hypothetical protein Q8917_12775 [Bacillota bacterium]|nr:hypothetical protein [Bacillota bacterium]